MISVRQILTSRWVNLAILVMFALFGLVNLYLLFIDPFTTKVEEEYHHVTLARPGQDLHVFHVDRRLCTSARLEYTVRAEIIGPVVYAMPLATGVFEEGCHAHVRARTVPVLPDGDYEWTTRYEVCNVLRCYPYPASVIHLRFRAGMPEVTDNEVLNRQIGGS